MGRISYLRQTQIIEEVKALEEQQYKKVTNERLFGSFDNLRKTIDDTVILITNQFKRLSCNQPEYAKYVVRSEANYMVNYISFKRNRNKKTIYRCRYRGYQFI